MKKINIFSFCAITERSRREEREKGIENTFNINLRIKEIKIERMVGNFFLISNTYSDKVVPKVLDGEK